MSNFQVQVHRPAKRKIDTDGNNSADMVHSIDGDCSKDYEFVLVVPQKLTKHAQNVIYSRQVTPLRYHLEGRFGSRTHRIDESHMGLPLTSCIPRDESKALLEKAATLYEDLSALINTEGVSFQYKTYFEPAPHKARQPPYVDARIHLEREPEGRGDNAFWMDFMRSLKSKSAFEAAQTFNRDIKTAATVHHVNHFSLREERDQFTYAELFAGKTLPDVLAAHKYPFNRKQNR